MIGNYTMLSNNQEAHWNIYSILFAYSFDSLKSMAANYNNKIELRFFENEIHI